MKNTKKGSIALILIIIAVLVIGGGSAYIIKQQNTKKLPPENTSVPSQTPIESATAPDTTSSSTVAMPKDSVETKASVQITVDTDVEKVKVIMAEIRSAYLSQDNTKFLKYASVSTKNFFSSATAPKMSSFSIGKVFKAGNVIVAEFTATTENGAPQNQTMVFIKEGGDWKFDLQATVDYEKNKTSATASDKNGYVDLVVTGIKVYPAHPIVNDPNVEIVVSIKNLGTKTSEKGAPASGELIEFTDAIPTQGGQLAPISAKETVTWSYKPYSHNTFFNNSDTPGKKTVKITLNEDKDVTESNYANNIFTQTIEMFSN